VGVAFVEDVIFIAPQCVYEEVSRGSNPFIKKIFVETLQDQGHTEDATEITETPIRLPQICFEEDLTLHLHPLTFEIQRLGGHSPACSVVYVPEEGIVFSGDVVINDPCPGMRDANEVQWMKALSWIEELDVETIVPGHGEVCGKEVCEGSRIAWVECGNTWRDWCRRAGPKPNRWLTVPSRILGSGIFHHVPM
jgi:hypothetical protein